MWQAKTEQNSLLRFCFPVKKRCAIMNPATGECRFTPFRGVMCVTLFEKLSLLIAAATLVVNITESLINSALPSWRIFSALSVP